jgi:RimJ/RimL family protein N-acetyltransferase
MQKVEEGEAFNNEKIDFRFNLFLSRWKKGDPFTAYSILDKENHYIGYICLGQPGPAGTAEIAYIIHPRFQGQGFGTEIIKAIMGSLVPELTAANHQVNGKTFDTVVATARTDNPASAKMLLHSGFIRDKTDEKYGAERLHLRFPLKKLLSFLQRDANDGAEISAFAMASSPFGRRRL